MLKQRRTLKKQKRAMLRLRLRLRRRRMMMEVVVLLLYIAICSKKVHQLAILPSDSISTLSKNQQLFVVTSLTTSYYFYPNYNMQVAKYNSNYLYQQQTPKLIITITTLKKMQKSLIKRISSILPVLKNKSSKGNNGRIAIIGGSYQFTGAPFYSAISALKSGADLAHIFCSKSSSTSIKAYSPEIIVHPVFVSEQEKKYDRSELPQVYEQWLEKIRSWEKAIHCWVIGPGLGRDPYMNQFFPILIRNIGRNKVVIFDADGIYYLAQHPELFGYLKHCKTIITPNSKQLSFIKPYLNFNSDLQLDFTSDSNPQNPNQPPSLQICPSAFLSPSASRPPFSSSSPLTPSPFSSSSPPSPSSSSPSSSYQQIQQLPNKYRHLHNFTLLLKGQQDIILGSSSYIVRTQGGPKRCGGIGDILAGVCSACSLWNFQLGPVLASRIVRKATNFAYQKEGRSMTAPSIVKQLSRAIRQIQNQNK